MVHISLMKLLICFLEFKENECNLGYRYHDQQRNFYEILPGVYELNDINIALEKSVQLKADEKRTRTITTAHHERKFISELNEVLGFTKKTSCWNTFQ